MSMDFIDEGDINEMTAIEESQDTTSGNSIFSSSQASSVRVLRRGNTMTSGKNVRMKGSKRNDGGSSSFSNSAAGDDFSFDGSSSSLVVRGAGTSSWAVQDAGTVQMLTDECAYLCSAFVSARSTAQALETATDLAKLLSSKKSRSVLWQSCSEPNSMAMVSSPMKSRSNELVGLEPNKKARSNTILDALLDVIACVTNLRESSNSRRGLGASSNDNKRSITSSSLTGSATRGARTKSARRRLKQQQNQPIGASASHVPHTAWWNSKSAKSTPELSQVIAMIVYFLSLDCTLSKDYSVAAMSVASRPAIARNIRSVIMEHSKALHGIVHMCLNVKRRVDEEIFDKVPTSVGLKQEDNLNSRDSQSTTSAPRKRLVGLLSPASDGLSSISFVGDETPKASGDPTKAGRLKRQRRNRLQSQLVTRLSSVPEEQGCAEHTKTLGKDNIFPPARKRRKNEKTDLSFNSTASGSDFSKGLISSADPLSPSRRFTINETIPSSPTERSTTSSVVSTESLTSTIDVRLGRKIHQLRAKVHFLSDTKNSRAIETHGDCIAVSSDQADPWVSLLCLESLQRIINGKEGDETSCLIQEEDDVDASLDTEESSPLLYTNTLLGKSGILPILSKCMSQTLVGVQLELKESEHRHANLQNWIDRITILSSIIDNACLFNTANRRSFVEQFDPFSFDDGPMHQKKGKGLIFHILQYLCSTFILHKGSGDQPKESINDISSCLRLVSLRTLTSLTHENELTGEQMVAKHNFFLDNGITPVPLPKNGIDILTGLILELESPKFYSRIGEMESRRYDSTIFCLNTLSNIIESYSVRELLTEAIVCESYHNQEILWVQWLSRWVVKQTLGFQEAVLSIGKTNGTKYSNHELQKSEDDKLVAAGNACVLLACLMKNPDTALENSTCTERARKLILNEIPQDKDGDTVGIKLIINTLKAFCNFYHFSLGDLSVAVVGPVKSLIDELLKI